MGRAAEAIQGDTTAGREACEAIVKAALDAFGKVDILVNNAGITRDNLLMRMDEEEWDSVIATNLSGPFWMTRAVARPMLKARSGRIINMSSAWRGGWATPARPTTPRAKAGLIGLTKTTARELASRGITCNAIAPGLIETELTADMPAAATDALINMTPLGYVGSVEDVAAAAVYFASDEARYVTGQVLGVDGGIMMGAEHRPLPPPDMTQPDRPAYTGHSNAATCLQRGDHADPAFPAAPVPARPRPLRHPVRHL